MSPGLSNGVWFVDSGAGLSITGDHSLFFDFIHSSDGLAVKFGDGVIQRSQCSGSIVLSSDKLPTSTDQCSLHPSLSCQSTVCQCSCPLPPLHNHLCTSCIATQASSVLWSFPASSDGVYKFASRPCECSELCTVSEPGTAVFWRSKRLFSLKGLQTRFCFNCSRWPAAEVLAGGM